MLVELCARIYDTLDGVVNGVDGASKISHKLFENHLYGYNFIIPKLEIKQERKICTFVNNSL